VTNECEKELMSFLRCEKRPEGPQESAVAAGMEKGRV
jgi:hypothetical protein